MTLKPSALVFDSRQFLIHYSATCESCGAANYARNAQAWAHQHTRKTGHQTELQLGFVVRPR